MIVIHKPSGKRGEIPDDKFDPAVFSPVEQATRPQGNGVSDYARSVFQNVAKPFVNTAKTIGAAAIQTPVLLASQGKVNIPIMNEEELTKAGTGEGFRQQVRDSASIASYAVPGGKTYGQALKYGAAAGALQGFGNSQDGNELESTMGGAVGGAVLGTAAKGVGDVVQKVSGVGKNAAQNTTNKIINPKVKPSVNMVNDEQNILNTVNKYTKGTSAERLAQLPDTMDMLGSKVSDTLRKNKTTVELAPTLTKLDEVARTNTNFDPNMPSYDHWKNHFINQISDVSEAGNKVSAENLYAMKKKIADQIPKAFDKERGIIQGELTPKEDVGLAMWKEIDNMITAADPTVKELTMEMSYLHRAPKGLDQARNATTSVQIPFAGNKVNINQDTAQKIQQKVADVVQKPSQIINDISTQAAPLVQKAGQLTGGSLGASQPSQESNSPNNDATYQPKLEQQNNNAHNAAYSNTNSTSSQPVSKFPIEKYQQALILDAQMTGGKNAAKLKALYEAMNQGGEKPPSYTAGQLTELSDIQTSINQMQSVQDVLTQFQGKMGPIKGVSRYNPYDTDAQSFNAQMRSAAQVVGKAMEGGVLRKEDEEKYRKMLPNIQDTPEVAQKKLNQIIVLLQDKLRVKSTLYSNSKLVGDPAAYAQSLYGTQSE